MAFKVIAHWVQNSRMCFFVFPIPSYQNLGVSIMTQRDVIYFLPAKISDYVCNNL